MIIQNIALQFSFRKLLSIKRSEIYIDVKQSCNSKSLYVLFSIPWDLMQRTSLLRVCSQELGFCSISLIRLHIVSLSRAHRPDTINPPAEPSFLSPTPAFLPAAPLGTAKALSLSLFWKNNEILLLRRLVNKTWAEASPPKLIRQSKHDLIIGAECFAWGWEGNWRTGQGVDGGALAAHRKRRNFLQTRACPVGSKNRFAN